MSSIADHDTSSILNSLRNCTRTVHQRLHQHPLTRNLVRRGLSLNQYVTALYAFDRYHEMIERELHKFPQLTRTSGRPLSTLIKCDYQVLTGNTSNPLPPCPPLKLKKSSDAGLGLLYVIEGSRQGGSVIARNLANTLALNSEYGAAFFTHGSNSLRSDWEQFVHTLNGQSTDSYACCTAAINTFERLESYLWSVHKARPVTIVSTERTTR